MDKKKIRVLRKKWGLAEFAGKLGVSTRTVLGWESGRSSNASALVMLRNMAIDAVRNSK